MEELLSTTLQGGIVPGIILAVYLIIVKIIDTKKEAQKSKMTQTLITSLENINNYIISTSENIIKNDKNKCEVVIKEGLDATRMRIMETLLTTLINNHIDINKDNITSNVKDLIKSEYYIQVHNFGMYVINGVNVSFNMKTEWISNVSEMIINTIFNEKLDMSRKLITINNRLKSMFNTYRTYLINNGIR